MTVENYAPQRNHFHEMAQSGHNPPAGRGKQASFSAANSIQDGKRDSDISVYRVSH